MNDLDLLPIIREMQRELARAHVEIARLKQAHDHTIIHGPVTDRDKDKGVRVQVGINKDGQPVKSPWLPVSQIAGARKVWSMPSIGQTLTLKAPNGDLTQAVLAPFTWSDNNPAPTDDLDADVDLRGKLRKTQKDADDKTEVDGLTVRRTKQTHETIVHKDPETEEEGRAETVDDKHPWKGNRAKAKHRKKLTKDGGFALTINEGEDGQEHRIFVKPTDDGVEISTHSGKHKVTVTKNAMTLSFGDGQHETTLSDSGIHHKSASRITTEAPQIAHLGDLMVGGSIFSSKTIQSAMGMVAPAIAGAPGAPPNANTW